jgi:hypothetical protein
VSDKENTKYFTGTKKGGGEKIAQRRLRRLQFFGAQNARTRLPIGRQAFMQLPFVETVELMHIAFNNKKILDKIYKLMLI